MKGKRNFDWIAIRTFLAADDISFASLRLGSGDNWYSGQWASLLRAIQNLVQKSQDNFLEVVHEHCERDEWNSYIYLWMLVDSQLELLNLSCSHQIDVGH